MKNQLINVEWVNRAKEIVKAMAPDEKALTLYACKLLEEQVYPLVYKDLIDGEPTTFNFVINNEPHSITVVKTLGKKVIQDIETIDYHKAIDYAKANGLNIPYKTEVDTEALQNELWFQQHLNEFKVVIKQEKTTKPTQKIIRK